MHVAMLGLAKWRGTSFCELAMQCICSRHLSRRVHGHYCPSRPGRPPVLELFRPCIPRQQRPGSPTPGVARISIGLCSKHDPTMARRVAPCAAPPPSIFLHPTWHSFSSFFHSLATDRGQTASTESNRPYSTKILCTYHRWNSPSSFALPAPLRLQPPLPLGRHGSHRVCCSPPRHQMNCTWVLWLKLEQPLGRSPRSIRGPNS